MTRFASLVANLTSLVAVSGTASTCDHELPWSMLFQMPPNSVAAKTIWLLIGLTANASVRPPNRSGEHPGHGDLIVFGFTSVTAGGTVNAFAGVAVATAWTPANVNPEVTIASLQMNAAPRRTRVRVCPAIEAPSSHGGWSDATRNWAPIRCGTLALPAGGLQLPRTHRGNDGEPAAARRSRLVTAAAVTGLSSARWARPRCRHRP